LCLLIIKKIKKDWCQNGRIYANIDGEKTDITEDALEAVAGYFYSRFRARTRVDEIGISFEFDDSAIDLSAKRT
jgi:hypothetical protein